MTHQTLRQKREKRQRIFLSSSFRYILIVMIILFSVLYFAKSSALATRGYDIGDLENKIESLQQDNQKIEFEIANYRSIRSIENRLARLGMVEADNIEYANMLSPTFAMR